MLKLSGNAGDSGVSARMFGTLLTWLSDRTSQVMVIATANSVERLSTAS
jgi:SpoVK/Ycf46/Vps4 family AAA+-type ATPase